ncbi:hypothetical protein CW304_21665 [Bacillus sp. UFRGS-B20]|nr:hypothetical protein CW304_21665 [Bacillus sp. UFRGS-B20]
MHLKKNNQRILQSGAEICLPSINLYERKAVLSFKPKRRKTERLLKNLLNRFVNYDNSLLKTSRHSIDTIKRTRYSNDESEQNVSGTFPN